MELPTYYTVNQVAAMFQTTRQQVYRLIKAGLPAYKVGKGWRIKESDLDRYRKETDGRI